MTDFGSWCHGAEIRLHPNWKERLDALADPVDQEGSVNNLRGYAEYLLRERWSDPWLNRAMLVTSVALWLTEGVGVVLLKTALNTGERSRGILGQCLVEWKVPDLFSVQIVSYDSPLRGIVESILYEQDKRLYADCHSVMEREVGGYLGEHRIREAAEISKAYHVSALNPRLGMERYCGLFERGLENHEKCFLKRVQGLSSNQRKRHFSAQEFDRLFLFFEGFGAYSAGNRPSGLRLLEEIVTMDGLRGPSDLPAQVAFHLVGNSYLNGRYADIPKALSLIARAVEIARENQKNGALAQTLTTLGRAYAKSFDLPKAAETLREAVAWAYQSDRSSPSFPLCELAEIEASLGRTAQAENAAKEVLALDKHPRTTRAELMRCRQILMQVAEASARNE